MQSKHSTSKSLLWFVVQESMAVVKGKDDEGVADKVVVAAIMKRMATTLW